MVMGFQDTLDIGKIARALGERFHDHDRFRRRQRYRHACDLDVRRAAHDLLLQGQQSQQDVDLRFRWLMREQRNPTFLREREGVVNARNEAELPPTGKKFRPRRVVNQHEHVDIFGKSRPTQD